MVLDDLNPQQREAVETVNGPLLILAGAGSGKTRVITYRVAHLIEDLGARPESVLAVTFTNKAAGEMAERVEQMAGARLLRKPWISTFHSFCVRVLRRDIEALQVNGAGYRKDFVIYDEADQQNVVKAAMRRLGLDTKQMTPSAVQARISWAKNHMLDPQEVYLQSADPKAERVAHIYKVYEQELRKANALDFDDLLLQTVHLLRAIPEARQYWSGRFDYVLVDEYQDTNRPQYELLKALATVHQNICAVGDEDQSIYSWRGADIRNILDFEHDFPGARIIRLEQNYRSTQIILEAASAVVANNIKRKGKTLWTARPGGAKAGYYEAPDGENEALFVADVISKYLQEAAERGETPRAAVLYRTNAQSRLFEEAMRRYQLAYHVVGGFSFYERAEIKDLISYLKLIHNLDDSVALLRVVNTPARGVGRTSLEVLERIALETGLSMWGAVLRAIEGALLPPRAVASLKGFKDIIEGARAMLAGAYLQWLGDSEDKSESDASDRAPETQRPATTAELLKFLFDRTGYIRLLEEEDTPESLARVENLHELVNAAMDSADRGESLEEFLDHAALVSDADQYDEKAQISLMTLHSAKGLEFPLVFLVGMEEGLLPHSRTFLNPDDVEEERRLCYVGMTRAMDRLVLTRARYRRRYGTDMPEAGVASRFLEEIPEKLIEDLGSPRARTHTYAAIHYNYEDEDQRPHDGVGAPSFAKPGSPSGAGFARDGVGKRSRAKGGKYTGPTYNSIENIAEFFASQGKKFARPKIDLPEPAGRRGFRPGQRVRHPKYGEGIVYQREGEGEDAKITVKFNGFGLKKLVEKYAQLERA
jgi:DNA helicase-2/ATP-dependent DNA helicase PcrA